MMGELIQLQPRTYWQDAHAIPWTTLARAKRLMRRGHDLYETAALCKVRPRDLDYSLWVTLGTSEL